MNFIAEVRIELKRGVEDPEGMSTNKALRLLGFKNIVNVRAIKVFEIEVTEEDKIKVKERVEAMCEKLLANPVIHNYSISIKEL